MKWAAGTAYAHEEKRNVYEYRDAHDRSHEAADVLGSGGEAEYSGTRQRWSTFTEVSLPVLHDWDLVLAGRLDEHDDVGTSFSHQITSRYRLHKALTLRGSWNRASRAPDLSLLYRQPAIYHPYVCDTRTFTGDREDCPRRQVEFELGGNLNLKPDSTESFNLGAVMSWGPFSLSADWFRLELSDLPTLSPLPAQDIIDLEAAGQLPSGAEVIRSGGRIERIRAPSRVSTWENDVAGFNVQGTADWKSDWADVLFAAYWLHQTEDTVTSGGRRIPHTYPRNRVHALVRASRDNVTANWGILAFSSYPNRDESARFEAWVGHNVTLSWRNALGVKGMELAGGILNIGNSGPSIATPTQVDTTLDSTRGRTFFLTANISFAP